MFAGAHAVLCVKQGDVTVVRFKKSKVTEEVYAKQAGAELKEIAERVGGKIVVDLSNVAFMTSVGISELVTFNKSVRSHGGHLKLCGVSPLLMQAFTSSGLYAVFAVYSTLEKALEAFRVGNGAAAN